MTGKIFGYSAWIMEFEIKKEVIKKVNVFGEITLKIELCLVTAAKKEGKIIVLIFIILKQAWNEFHTK